MKAAIENELLGEPASHTLVVVAPRERVWQIISNPRSLARYHPFCERNLVERWPGAGSQDTIYYYSGMVLERNFTNWIEGLGYDLVGRSNDGTVSKVSWRIEALDPDQSALTITIWPTIQPGTQDRSKQLSRLLKRYLQQVGEGIQYYVRTGKPVSRNQFGSHRLFSPPVVE